MKKKKKDENNLPLRTSLSAFRAPFFWPIARLKKNILNENQTRKFVV